MKKSIITLTLAVVCAFTLLAGCGGPAKRELYNLKLSKYVTLGDYKDLSVNTKSDDFKKYHDEILSSDVKDNDLYNQKGVVENGDTVNIDYTGTKDGVAFEGGTAQGYDLKIGSGSFIPGFEEGLVGKNIGETVELNLTFPEGYQSTDLAGKAVVFTVKINKKAMKTEEAYKKMGFKSEKAYLSDVSERAAKKLLVEKAVKNAKVKEYPETDLEFLYSDAKKRTEEYYGQSFSELLAANNISEADFISQSIKPMMDEQMALYAILDEENIKFTAEDIEKHIDKLVKQYNNEQVTKETLKEQAGAYYFEYLVVNEKVGDYLYKNASVK